MTTMTHTQTRTTGGTPVPRRGASSAAVILGWMAALALLFTLPLWIGPAVIWMIATGRSLKSCGEEGNKLSGMEGAAPSAPQEVTP